MPYELKGNCVHKVGEMKPMKCYDNHADALKYLGALEANVTKEQAIDKAASKDNFAYTPDDVPSHWKLDISDDQHIAMAIAALSGNAPHGNKVQLPPGAKAGVVKKISSAINSKVSDADKKQHLKDELAKVKSLSLEQIEIIKQSTVFDQSQVGYVPLSPKGNQACANCVFYRSTAYDGIDYPHCLIVENDDPDPIEATGWCNHWEAKPAPPADLADVIEEAIEGVGQVVTDAVTSAIPMMQMDMEHKPKSLLQRAKAALFPEKEMGAFNVYKGTDGAWHWVARYTNAYIDKEHEIFTEKAHEEFIQRVDMGLVDKPELWVWHTKGTKHGKADTLMGIGRIVVAVGHFDDTPEAKNAIKFYQKNADKLKLSHGALAPKWAVHDGLIESYNTFEISVLPDGAESNPYTSYEVIKSMQPDPKKIEMVATILGKEKAEQLVSGTAEYSKELDDMAIRYKDFAQTGAPATEPNADATKAMGEVFVEMVKEQGDLASLVIAMSKKIDAQDETIKSFTKELKETKDAEIELRKTINAGPRRPASDDSTAISKEDLEAIKKQSPNSDDKRVQARQFMGLPTNGSN